MKSREISVFSLSLLDLLFCAFGGVIVLTVVFSAIIKYERSQTEKSPQTAISLSVQYTNVIPPTWKLELRNTPLGRDRLKGNETELALFANLTHFRTLTPHDHGKFMVGIEGNLKQVEQGRIMTDTLYLTVYHDSPDPFSPVLTWNNPGGQIMIDAMIFRPGVLPTPISLAPMDANLLSRFDQAIAILLKLEKGELHISLL